MTAPATTFPLTLETPIKREGGDLAELTLRKPVAGELRGLKIGDLMTGDIAAAIDILPRITSPFITAQEAAAMDPADIAEAAGIVAGFFMTRAQKSQVAQMIGNSAPKT